MAVAFRTFWIRGSIYQQFEIVLAAFTMVFVNRHVDLQRLDSHTLGKVPCAAIPYGRDALPGTLWESTPQSPNRVACLGLGISGWASMSSGPLFVARLTSGDTG